MTIKLTAGKTQVKEKTEEKPSPMKYFGGRVSVYAEEPI